MSVLEEDGFVLVSKEGLPGGRDDDAVSVSSSRSSLCVVDDPRKISLLSSDDDEPQPETDVPDSDGASKADPEPAVDLGKASIFGSFQTSPAKSADSQDSADQAIRTQTPKYVCVNCSSDVAAQADLIWEGYMGANKSAYLFKEVLNVESVAEPRKQQLSTGLFLLQDVSCKACSTPFGWSYLRAWNQDQKYKEGATIVQQSLIRLKDA